MKEKIIILALVLAILAGCSQKQEYTNITAEELNSMMEEQDVYVIDVHVPEQQRIKGTDAAIPYNEIEQNLEKLPESKKIVLYCRSGSMSLEASKKLSALGYEVYNLLGGANLWKAQGYEMQS